MCGRYTIYQTGELKSRYQVDDQQADELLKELKARYNAAPGQDLPVVSQVDKRHLGLMRWGLIPKWAKDQNIGYKMINARAESLFDKPTWKYPATKHRCLVPVNGFYEWQRTNDGKQPFHIRLKGDDQIFSLGGLFGSWTNRETGEVIESFSIVTTAPNREMKPIHDRMPLILSPKDEARWLDPANDTPESIADLLKPLKDGQLTAYPVSPDVNKAANEGADLIKAIK